MVHLTRSQRKTLRALCRLDERKRQEYDVELIAKEAGLSETEVATALLILAEAGLVAPRLDVGSRGVYRSAEIQHEGRQEAMGSQWHVQLRARLAWIFTVVGASLATWAVDRIWPSDARGEILVVVVGSAMGAAGGLLLGVRVEDLLP